MKMFTIELPTQLTIEFRTEIGEQKVDLENKSADWLEWVIANGLRQSIADAIAGKVGTSEGVTAIKNKYQRVCIDGDIPTGGGTKPRTTVQEEAEIRVLRSWLIGDKMKKTEANKIVTKKLLASAWETVGRKMLIRGLAAEGYSAADMKELNLAEMVEENMDMLKGELENDIAEQINIVKGERGELKKAAPKLAGIKILKK